MGSRGGNGTREPAAGFTLVELLAILIVFGILSTIAFGAFQRYAHATAADRAASVLVGDLARARSYAVQRRGPVSLVVDEANRSYEIRLPGGPVLAVQDFGGWDTPLTLLDLQSADSVMFNARGLLVTGPLEIELARYDARRRVEVNALGRSRVTTP